MFIESSNKENKEIVSLKKVIYYYPENRGEAKYDAGGVPYIVFRFNGNYTTWVYDNEEERGDDLKKIRSLMTYYDLGDFHY